MTRLVPVAAMQECRERAVRSSERNGPGRAQAAAAAVIIAIWLALLWAARVWLHAPAG